MDKARRPLLQTLKRMANSLVTRLMVCGVVLVLGGAVARYHYVAEGTRQDLVDIISVQQTAKAEALAHDLEHRIQARHVWLMRLAAALPADLLVRPAELQRWLVERRGLFPMPAPGLLVVDPHGQILADARNLRADDAEQILRYPVVARALQGEGGIGVVNTTAASDDLVLPMAQPLRDGAGVVVGALVSVAELEASDLLSKIRTARIGRAGDYLLIDPASQMFLAAGDRTLDRKATPPPGVNALHDRAMAGFRGTGITVNAKGVEELSAMVSVPSTGWFVVARIPTSEAFEPVARGQKRVIVVAGWMLLGVCLVVGLMMRTLLRPLFQAAELAERMTQDEIPLRPIPVVRNDEVGHLTAAFNRLLEKLARVQEELAHVAAHDVLTGLPNRGLLADRMQRALARAPRLGTRVGVLFLDLDGFKPINDTLGHDAGDTALVELTRRLSGVIRDSDTLARVGGDEFVLLVDDLDVGAEAAVVRIAQRCIEAVSLPLTLKGQQRRLGVSIGIALSRQGCDANELLSAADTAMYEAKKAGRGGYVMAPLTPRPALEVQEA